MGLRFNISSRKRPYRPADVLLRLHREVASRGNGQLLQLREYRNRLARQRHDKPRLGFADGESPQAMGQVDVVPLRHPQFARPHKHQRREPHRAFDDEASLISVQRPQQQSHFLRFDHGREVAYLGWRDGAAQIDCRIALCALRGDSIAKHLAAVFACLVGRHGPRIRSSPDRRPCKVRACLPCPACRDRSAGPASVARRRPLCARPSSRASDRRQGTCVSPCRQMNT